MVSGRLVELSGVESCENPLLQGLDAVWRGVRRVAPPTAEITHHGEIFTIGSRLAISLSVKLECRLSSPEKKR